MPANVFATHQQVAVGVHVNGRMHRAAVLAQRLKRADALAQAVKPLCGRQGRTGQDVQLGQRLLDGFDAAQAATAGACQLATLLFEVPERTAGDFDVGILRRARTAEREVINIAGVLNDAAAQAETDDEILKVSGRHQHHRLIDAIEGNRQGDLFGEGRFSTAAVVQRDVVVILAGSGRGGILGGRRARGALGVHKAVPTVYSAVRVGATLCRV